MKQKEISLNIRPNDDDLGEDHVLSSWETPLRPDAFEMDDELKIKKIEGHFKEIMDLSLIHI